jgi:hypothetical protein
VKIYQVYARGEFVLETNSARVAVERVDGTRGGYVVTDGQGRRMQTRPSLRHTMGGLVERKECTAVLAALGPRAVGSVVRSAYWGSTTTVLAIHLGSLSLFPWSPWSVTVQDEHGVVRSHCTPWDVNDQIVTPEVAR